MSGFFDNDYPYTDFHELNLSWIISKIKSLATELEEFISLNTIKYADPIQWDITTQYESNTVVIDPNTGTAYISVQAVPSGVDISNSDYWTEVFNLNTMLLALAGNFTSRVETTSTATATFDTYTGEWLVWNNILYRALVDIVTGTAYSVGSNIEVITVEDIKDELLSTINSLYEEISDRVGALDDLTTTDISSIVNAINSLVTDLATEASTRESADETLQSNIDAEASAREAADTTLQSNIDAEATTRASADTTLQSNIDEVLEIANTGKKRVFMLFGDSYGRGTDGDDNTTIVTDGGWAVRFQTLMESYGATVYYSAVSGGFATASPTIDDYNSLIEDMTDEEISSVTDVVFIGGWNDQWITTSTVQDAVETFCATVRELMPTARILIAPMTCNPLQAMSSLLPRYKTCQKYGAELNLKLINVLAQFSFTGDDGIHPTSEGYSYIQPYVTSVILTGDCHYHFGVSGVVFTETTSGDTITVSMVAEEDEIRITPTATNRGKLIYTPTTTQSTRTFTVSSDNYIQLPSTNILKDSVDVYTSDGAFTNNLGIYATAVDTLTIYSSTSYDDSYYMLIPAMAIKVYVPYIAI